MVRRPDVLVVGDGLVGRCVARELAQRGASVDLLTSRVRAPASRAAAGMLSPLSESSSGTAFEFSCLAARDLWLTWAEQLRMESGRDLGFDSDPTVLFAFDDDQHRQLDLLRQRAEVAGDSAREIGPKELYERLPQLRSGAVSGLLLMDEPRIDPHQVLDALDYLLALAGVVIHKERDVERIEIAERGVQLLGADWRTEAPHVVMATGAWAATVQGLGLDEIIQPVRGQMIAYQAPDGMKGCVRHQEHYALVRDELLLFGATEEHVGYVDVVTEEALGDLRDAAEALFPSLAWRKVERHWSGLRPATRDGLPMIGHWLSDRLVVATGMFRNGVLLAPWCAPIVADLLLTGSSGSLPMEMAAARFVD